MVPALLRKGIRRILSQLPARSVVKRFDKFRMRLDTSQHIDTELLYRGTFEPDTILALRRITPNGGVAVDVGANIGWITLNLASMVGPSGCVFAYEPSDWSFDRLCKNI